MRCCRGKIRDESDTPEIPRFIDQEMRRHLGFIIKNQQMFEEKQKLIDLEKASLEGSTL